jgi:hypothetical protein
MNSYKNMQHGYSTALGVTHYGAHPATRLAERISLVHLLQQQLKTVQEVHGHVSSLELRSRNVSFVDVRRLFHRIGAATEQCAVFLAERVLDLGALPLPNETHDRAHALSDCDDLSFAECLHQIGERTHLLSHFSTQTKSLMDKAVVNGDYNSLHVMTDCIYQISQLVALIQIYLPTEPSTLMDSIPETTLPQTK